MKTTLPETWLIVLIAGLTLLTETVYTPALPEIAHTLRVAESLVEYTLTIYLFGFGVGTFFWGKLSDKMGRKPCILAGLVIFIIGCGGCYWSSTITSLMFSRLVQGFGGSIGSVLGQAVARDAFHGPALGRVYSAVGGALQIFPAIGPVIGGLIAERYGWSSIFLFLIACAAVLLILVIQRLPETHPVESRNPVSVREVLLRMLGDRKVLGCGLIVGLGNGIAFSYFSEGSFYMIQMLGLSPSQYGYSFIGIAFVSFWGGVISKRLQAHHTSQAILTYGLWVVIGATGFFLASIGSHLYLIPLSLYSLIGVTLLSQMVMGLGLCIALPNALSLALTEYRSYTGTASSLFGFFYYSCMSLATLGMGALHNGTLLPMPVYFLTLALLMMGVKSFLLKK